jgi:hypothetical protein
MYALIDCKMMQDTIQMSKNYLGNKKVLPQPHFVIIFNNAIRK